MKYLCIKPFGYYKVGLLYTLEEADKSPYNSIGNDYGIVEIDLPLDATDTVFKDEIKNYFKPLPEVQPPA